MRYFKNVENDCIVSIGTGPGYVEITEEEYNQILEIIRTKPTTETGYDYRLKENLTWELVEVPIVEAMEEEATEADYLDALADLGVEV